MITGVHIAFWLSLAIMAYTYAGYPIILHIWSLRNAAKKRNTPSSDYTHQPPVTILIPAHNEAECIADKIRNCRQLDYPKEKLCITIVSDGSTDTTNEIVAQFDDVKLIIIEERGGKIAAINQAIQSVPTPITILSDANIMLSSNTPQLVAAQFADSSVGVVTGTKKIMADGLSISASEGLYWRIESHLKALESDFHSCLGASGEMMAIRTDLFPHVEPDTILDDFLISMRICLQGYRIAFIPEICSEEHASTSFEAELERKIRIAAGAFQSTSRLRPLLNPRNNYKLTFQYLSHKIARWIFAPVSLVVILITNLWIITTFPPSTQLLPYQVTALLQCTCYLFATIGWLSRKARKIPRLFYIPFYFCLMNYAYYVGYIRFLRNRQPVTWEKAQRIE